MEDVKLGFRDGVSVRTGGFRQKSDDNVDVLDVVHHAAIRMSEAIVVVGAALRARDPE